MEGTAAEYEVPTEPGYTFMSDRGMAFSYWGPWGLFCITEYGQIHRPERLVALSAPKRVTP